MNQLSTRDTLFYLDRLGRISEAKSWTEAESKNSFRAIVEIDASTEGVTKPVARAKTKTQIMKDGQHLCLHSPIYADDLPGNIASPVAS